MEPFNTSCDVVVKVIIAFVIFSGTGKAIVSIQEYCDKFNNYSVKPLICLLQLQNPNYNYTTRPPPIEEEWETDEVDDCSCNVNCFPPFDNNDSFTDIERQILPISELQCQPCGANCPVKTFIQPRCSCAVLSSSSASRCKCSVTCASSQQLNDDPFCIFNVTRITKLRDPSRVFTCECDKSKAAQDNPYPDFACICQPNI